MRIRLALILAIALGAPGLAHAGDDKRSEYCARVALREAPSLYAELRCSYLGRSRLRTLRYLRETRGECSKAECRADRYQLRHGRPAPWRHR